MGDKKYPTLSWNPRDRRTIQECWASRICGRKLTLRLSCSSPLYVCVFTDRCSQQLRHHRGGGRLHLPRNQEWWVSIRLRRRAREHHRRIYFEQLGRKKRRRGEWPTVAFCGCSLRHRITREDDVRKMTTKQNKNAPNLKKRFCFCFSPGNFYHNVRTSTHPRIAAGILK